MKLKSTSSVHSHLEQLERNGYIRRDPTKPRTIEITDDTFNLARRELVNVPLIGTVAAGAPLLGDSMIEAGILSGDRVIVAQTDTAENGEIVVALLDDSATVKRFFREDGYIRLQPENSSMEPILVKQVRILGRVIGLFRMMA